MIELDLDLPTRCLSLVDVEYIQHPLSQYEAMWVYILYVSLAMTPKLLGILLRFHPLDSYPDTVRFVGALAYADNLQNTYNKHHLSQTIFTQGSGFC